MDYVIDDFTMMKITENVLRKIHKAASGCCYEIGGILGSSIGDCIDAAEIDIITKNSNCCCCYEPNVDYLNQVIGIWQEEGILFKGIFHTHLGGGGTLSFDDRLYIDSIMKEMPQSIRYLYFPIYVLPNCELRCYKAALEDKELLIQEEILIIER